MEPFEIGKRYLFTIKLRWPRDTFYIASLMVPELFFIKTINVFRKRFLKRAILAIEEVGMVNALS